jgi:hypothetical protein
MEYIAFLPTVPQAPGLLPNRCMSFTCLGKGLN